MKITTIATIVALTVLPMTSSATEVLVVEPVAYTDQQVIAATVGCAVLFGALAAMTSGVATAVGAVFGGSICAVGFGEDYFQGDRIVGYESGA